MSLPTIMLTAALTLAAATTASAQTLGQSAAAAVREQAVENALADRGINVDLSRQRARGFYPQSNYYTRRPAYGYGYGRPYYGGYYPPVQNFGYGYGYGYNPGLYIHQFRTPARGSTLRDGRQNTPGSHYFGPPHASQYLPGH